MKPRDTDQQTIIRLGDRIRTRLAADANVYQVPNEIIELYAIGDFVRPNECDHIVKMIDDIAYPSELLEDVKTVGFRTSFSANLDHDDPIVKGVSRRIDDVLGLAPETGEPLQGQRYQVGQEFKPHNDWFYTTEKYWADEKRRGGQRIFTAMAYLNDVEEGGATEFVNAGLSVAPKRGALIMWSSSDKNGAPNEGTLHAGTPVIAGTKYIVTKWYRVRKWG